MKKNFVLAILLGCSLFSCKEIEKHEYRKVPCKVLSVKHYGVGELNTLQLDPIWEIQTSCGNSAKMRKPYQVGDTIWIYYVDSRNVSKKNLLQK
jgi:hypothetical protein